MKRTHLPLNALRVFDAAARHLSFTRAADELAVTPAAVGQQIRALERRLGRPWVVEAVLEQAAGPEQITGRIGRSFFTVGALVSATQADPLTQIQRLDPIFVDIQQSSADLLALRRTLQREGIVAGSAAVRGWRRAPTMLTSVALAQ